MKFTIIYIVAFTLMSITLLPMQKSNNKVAQKAEDVCPINIGEEIPSVNVRDVDGKEINLLDLTKGKKSILIFYRGGWCPYCNIS
jgi:cytochrome oxidase Cu insertion factor (SCO1/SenC/PrrC family)